MKMPEIKLKSRFKMPQFLEIDSVHGRLSAEIKVDLDDEEFDGYVPAGYRKEVLELSMIEASRIGVGDGDALMTEFLKSDLARSAQLIFLDPNPGFGHFASSEIADHVQIEKLKEFYRKHGFRNHPQSNRMWRVQEGMIPDETLPR
jgi:hypothetical protein